MLYTLNPCATFELREPEHVLFGRLYQKTFISARLDYGFKHIFSDRERLLSLLNSVLPAEEQINDLRLLPQEDTPDTHDGKRLIYDVLCETDTGERIIVEMQNQPHFRLNHRMTVYESRQLLTQLDSKDKRYSNVKTVYSFWFMDFEFVKPEESENKSIIWACQMIGYPELGYPRELSTPIKTAGNEPLSPVKRYIIQLPLFNKSLDELESTQDKWLYFIRFADTLDHIPPIFEQDELFRGAFERARYSTFTEEEMELYNRLLDSERVHNERMDYVMQEGLEKGLEKGREEVKRQIALNLLAMKLPLEQIVQATGLSEQTILSLDK